jgi:serine/threonine-protein kinase
VGLEPGTKVDRYEVIREIASGGMGAVYLARFAGKHGFEKKVALKTILPEYAERKPFRDMLLDEARICARLSHPNVAEILDVGETGDQLFIAFEYVDGCSLGELCRRAEADGGRIDVGILLRLCADACAGLHAVHELREPGDDGRLLDVVHRDVTPENILVDGDGFAKIIDFGIAKTRDRLAPDTRSGLVKGTPQYMAPEQATGANVDRRADVWAMGAVLFRALAGAPPFPHREALGDFICGLRPWPRLPDGADPDLATIVERAMARYAGDRFATAEDLREALERVLAKRSEPVTRAQIVRAVGARRLKSGPPGADPALAATAPVAPAARRSADVETSNGRNVRRAVLIAALALLAALLVLAAAFVVPLQK